MFALYNEELVSRSDTFQGWFKSKEQAREWCKFRPLSKNRKYRLDYMNQETYERFYLENGRWNLA